jgi:hypothetical protein|nr:hypothetical protein [Rahnella aceris]
MAIRKDSRQRVRWPFSWRNHQSGLTRRDMAAIAETASSLPLQYCPVHLRDIKSLCHTGDCQGIRCKDVFPVSGKETFRGFFTRQQSEEDHPTNDQS